MTYAIVEIGQTSSKDLRMMTQMNFFQLSLTMKTIIKHGIGGNT